MRRLTCTATIGGCLAVWLGQAIAQSNEGLDKPKSQVDQFIADLDADRFEVRQRAERELESLISATEGEQLATHFRRTLASPHISFEVRSRLTAWLKRFPAGEQRVLAPAEEIARLLDQAVGDSYAVRTSAIDQLQKMAETAQPAIPLLTELRRRLADPTLASGDYESLLRLYERARGAWLLSDPSEWRMPPASDADIKTAVQQLTQPAPASHAYGKWRPHAAAHRLLLDLMCQDELVAKIKAALETRKSNVAMDDASGERLDDVLQWTEPSLVAEIWKNRRQIAEQHLLVDVPRLSLTATRPSHFSRIDDRTAHCVSGQNLTPGDYPVGLAIAHPEDTQWMCHLVNLPTPRRRMRYAYDAQRDEQVRLAELTERTLRAYTAQSTYLSELQILLLPELHAATVSRLIGEYFLAVDDRRLEPGPFSLGGVNASHHARICAVLSTMGTRDVAPKLMDALQEQRFLPPRPDVAPLDWPWIAALAIAERDPWDNVDAWLGSLLDRRERLMIDAPDEDEAKRENGMTDIFPELGASAAALLLDRHEQRPESFGLQSVSTSELRTVGCPAYRFRTPTARQEVIRWWESQKKQRVQQEKTP